MPQHWERDPSTGDYKLEKGKPVETNSLRIPALHRIKTKRKQWMYAPNNQYGSDLHTVEKIRSTTEPTVLENLVGNCLSSLVEDGRANQINVEVTQRARHGYGLQIRILTSEGRIDDLVFEAIGD